MDKWIVVVQATEKLVAFLFGIASHMVADVSWHSLGIDQGFLKTMGEVSLYYFLCSYDWIYWNIQLRFGLWWGGKRKAGALFQEDFWRDMTSQTS